MSRPFRIALATSVVAVVAAGVAVFAAWRSLSSPMSLPPDGASFEVVAGTPLAKLAADLGERDLLPHPLYLTVYARLSGDATRIQVGEYRVPPATTPLELLDMLVEGKVVLYQLTVVEGWRFAEFLSAVRTHPAVVSLDLDAAAIMAELGSPGVAPEGQFLPDTYVFPKGTTDLQLLRLAHEALGAKLAAAWETRSPDIVLEDPYEALILASIIEKETALPAERRVISGVFQARLRRGMRLQTDPTVIYGLGDAFDGNLRRRDLARDTPYNTYTRRGLPPTPIALPGVASLEAAVNPEPTTALYFVATGEPDGSHRFSATVEEHNAAVRRYLERTRQVTP